VGILFALGTFCIIITIVRLVSVYDTKSAQPTRSFWASVQMIVSTFVANAPTIYGDLNIAKRKKNEPMVRRRSPPELWAPDSRTDIEHGGDHLLAFPERVATSFSQSSTKEWFDHVEHAH